MAIIAMAARFSQDPFFQNEQAVASAQYARIAWTEVFESSFADETPLDISIIQATNMLAIANYTGRAIPTTVNLRHHY